MTSLKGTLITIAGWEERFIIGVRELLSSNNYQEVKLLVAEEYQEHLTKNIYELTELASTLDVVVSVVNYRIYDNSYTWNSLSQGLNVESNSKTTFDVSTAPREIIWFVLHFLNQESCNVKCLYSRPKKYGDWLSKDPGRPRLVFNHSGITDLSNPTALVVISGFDLERANQLIQFFEPKKTILALQTGDQYNNQKLNVFNHLHKLEQLCEIGHFELDTFAYDGGFKALNESMSELARDYNVIATSLGPKPSAVALFKLQLLYPQIALCYVPSLSYNIADYSVGFDGFMEVEYLD